MPDLLVKLYDLPDPRPAREALVREGYAIKRAMPMDARTILDFVRDEFRLDGWVEECRAALMRQPSGCFVAEFEGRPVGFACHDVAAKGMFGPTGVAGAHRRHGLGRALLLASLETMAAEGYAYAVIGWAGDPGWYARAVGAVPIDGSEPGPYRRALGR